MRTMVLILSAAISVMGQQMTIHNPLDSDGMIVYPSDSPEFTQAVRKILEPGDLDALRSLLPYCLVIKNATSGFLAGITVLYTVPDVRTGGGQPYRIRTSARTASRDRKEMFAPGDMRLVSPISIIQGTLGGDGVRTLWPRMSDGALRMVSTFVNFYGKKRLDVSLDSIITEDGYLVGPDAGKLFDDVNPRLRAEYDIARELDGLRGMPLQRKLKALLGANPPPEDEYARWRILVAERYQDGIHEIGESEFVKGLNAANHTRETAFFREIKRRKQ